MLDQTKTEAQATQELFISKSAHFLILSRVVSNLGDQMYMLVIPWIVFNWSRSAWDMSLMRAIDGLPYVILGVIAGWLVDNISRRLLIMVCVIGQMCLVFVLPIVNLWHVSYLWLVFIIGFLSSSLGFIFSVAYETLIPVMANPKSLMAVTSRIKRFSQLARVVGPGIAGVAIGMWGVMNTLLLDAVSFFILLIGILSVRKWDNRSRIKEKTGTFGTREVFRFIWAERHLRTSILLAMLGNTGLALSLPLIVLFVPTHFHVGASMTGVVMTVAGIAAVGGSYLPVVLGRWAVSPGVQLTLSMVSIAAGYLIMSITGTYVLFAAGYAIQSLAAMWANILSVRIRQIYAPKDKLGSVTSMSFMAARLITPLAMLFGGVIAAHWGVQVVFLITSVIGALSVIISLSVVRMTFQPTN